jgi:thymidine kinase
MKPRASARWLEQVERQLVAHGIDLIEIKTICRSGKQATMNARLDEVSSVAHRRPAT